MTPQPRGFVGAPKAQGEDRSRSSLLDVLVLCTVLSISAVNTSMASFAASLGAGWVLLRHAQELFVHARTVDLLALVTGGLVLLSPHWKEGVDGDLTSVGYGPAISLILFVAARRVLANARNMHMFLRGIAAITFIYGVYFIINAQVLDTFSSRRTVDFANANYTGAVLAYGVTIIAWLMRASPSVRLQILGLASIAVQGWAIVETGSRASLAGAGLAGLVILLGPKIKTYVVAGIVLIAAFLIGFTPHFDFLFIKLSSLLNQLPYVQREYSSTLDASGRLELWARTRTIIGQSWFLGWGPDRYRIQPDGPDLLAHSWGLEYMASVGLLGSILLVSVLSISFLTPYRKMSSEGLLLVTATGLALAPSLMLSTHQWTLWF